MLLKEYYQSIYGKVDTRIGRAFAPTPKVDDEQVIKYKADDDFTDQKNRKAKKENIVPKGSFRKIQEQWVSDNLITKADAWFINK